jgi:hypothetical protein
MSIKSHKKWILVAIIGLAWWLFGNMYEAIVISPNWIVNSPLQLKRLHDFFINTSPTIYFVPVTQFATVLVWILWWRNNENTIKKDHAKAGLLAILATALNIFIVTTIITKIFGNDFEKHGDHLATLCTRWNVLNVFRMLLVGFIIHYLFRAFRQLDKLPG